MTERDFDDVIAEYEELTIYAEPVLDGSASAVETVQLTPDEIQALPQMWRTTMTAYNTQIVDRLDHIERALRQLVQLAAVCERVLLELVEQQPVAKISEEIQACDHRIPMPITDRPVLANALGHERCPKCQVKL